MTTKEIFDANNRLLKQKVIDRMKELPKVNINPTTVHDFAFTQPIVELTTKQKTNFKNLLK
jgi:hypothetical protein